jgi:hypothetical protein
MTKNLLWIGGAFKMESLGSFRNIVSSEMLDDIFRRYKEALTGLVAAEGSSQYNIIDNTSEDYQNILTFVQNTVVKDQKLVDGVEANGSNNTTLSKTLKKYFENNLTEKDIIELRMFVTNYNKSIANKLYSSAYTYIYGLGEAIPIEESFYKRVTLLTKQRIEFFIQEFLKKNDANREITKSINEWYGISDNLSEVLPTTEPVSPEEGDRWVELTGTPIVTSAKLYTYTTDWDSGVNVPISIIETPEEGDRWFEVSTSTLHTYIVNEWFGDDDTSLSFQRSGRAVTLNEFYTSYFLKSNLIEALTALTIIFYLSDELKSVNDSFVVSDIAGSNLESESSFIPPVAGTIKEYTFPESKFAVEENKGAPVFVSTDPLNPTIEIYKQVLTYTLKTSDNPGLFSVPVYSKVLEGPLGINGNVADDEAESYISEIYNVLRQDDPSQPVSIEELELTFEELFVKLYSNLYGFLQNISYTENSSTSNYITYLSYFYNSDQGKGALSLNLNNDIRSAAQMYYLKDFIQEIYYLSTDETEKRSASIDQQSSAERGDQLVFIDVKGVSFSGDNLVTAREYFPSVSNSTVTARNYRGAPGRVVGGSEIDDTSGAPLKLTYVLLYKELSPVYRYYTLAEVQEFIFARMIQQIGKDALFISNSGSSNTFSLSANAIYRSFQERALSPFVLYDAYYTYRYFYGNSYKARVAEDSEIIGYFIGDNTRLSAFTRNYGAKRYQKEEIYKFLDIYKLTRDYFYKVLRNNSFIFDDAHSLYEKLFISFFAIERFLNSKIENIHDLDYYNSQDIENFLESYGLGIINQFKFLIDGEDYKINIVKNFAELTRKKGSKDVIETLLRVFQLEDREIDIKKFLLVDNINLVAAESTYNVALVLDEDNKLNVTVGTGSPVVVGENIAVEDLTFSEILEEVIDPFNPTNVFMTIADTDKYVDLREAVRDYFSQRVSLVLNENIDAPTTNTVLLLYKKNLTLFTRIVSYNSTFDSLTTDFNIIPSNLGYEMYDASALNSNPESEPIDTSLQFNDTGALVSETITITVSSIDSVLLAEYAGKRTKLFRIDGTSKSFAEILNDLDIVKTSVEDYPYTLRISSGSSPISASELISSQIEIQEGSFSVILKKRDLWIVYNNEFDLLVKTDVKVGEESLKFVEVAYESENGSKEIFNNLQSGVAYSSFIASDPYWDEEEVTQPQLLSLQLNTAETKYLSLVLRDNTYKKFAVARYLISSIEHFESKLTVAGNPILNNTKLDSGDSLFGEISIGDYFKIIKTLFKSIIRLYEAKIGNNIQVGTGSGDQLYYGIRDLGTEGEAEWNELKAYIETIISGVDASDSDDNFFKLEKLKSDATTEWIDFFNVYERGTDWVNYTSQGGNDNNLNTSFREVLFDNETSLARLNAAGDQLRNSVFTSHKTSFGRNLVQSYRDSGDYVIDMIENLNFILSTGSNEVWLNFLSKYFRGKEIVDQDTFIQQLFSRTVNTTEMYDKLISSLMKLPIDFFDGLLTSELEIDQYQAPEFVKLVERVFEAAYLTETDPLTVVVDELPQSVRDLIPDAISYLESSSNIPIDSNELNLEINALTQTLVSLVNTMKLLFGSQEYVDFAFSLKSEETATLDFLTTSVSLLLSYTTELYQIEFKRVYDTLSESFPVSDKAVHKITNKKQETVFYDDKLVIERLA